MCHDILIVDDSATIRVMIKKAVKMIGLDVGDVYEAGNGMEALAQLVDHPMAVVLVDINMPGMNGIQLIDAMRKHEALKETPVIIVTTEGGEPRIRELQGQDIAGYVRKPFRPEQLREVLEPILGSSNERNDFARTAEDLF